MLTESPHPKTNTYWLGFMRLWTSLVPCWGYIKHAHLLILIGFHYNPDYWDSLSSLLGLYSNKTSKIVANKDQHQRFDV